MKKYNISGMSCAACSSRVENVTRSVDGVHSCSVNLLTGTMLVEGGDEEKIFLAVRGAGYGISPAEEDTVLSDNERRTRNTLIRRLVLSSGILILLMYISMGYMMWSFPLPHILSSHPFVIGIIQLLLSLSVLIINRSFFINGIRHAIGGSANMDTLVALGSGVSFLWSVYIVIRMGLSPLAEQHTFLHNLYFESSAMIVTLITVGKLLEAIAKGKTTSAIKKLISLSPKTVTVIRDGKEVVILAKEITRGEVFVVKAGETVATDGVVISGIGAVDESSLTGESMPVEKGVSSTVLAGTILNSGYIKCEAVRVGEDTTMAKVIRLVSDASSGKAPVGKVADKVSSIFVPTVLVIALITFIGWIIATGDVAVALERGISVLVISCPCALGLATPVAIMVGVGIGAGNGILFKTAAALEGLGKVKNIAFDKTGTLTLGEVRVAEVYPIGIDKGELISLAFSVEDKSEHPIARAIVNYAVENNARRYDTEGYESSVGLGVCAYVGGVRISAMSYSATIEKITLDERVAIEYERMSKEGKTPIFVTRGDTLIGIIAVSDTIKGDAEQTSRELMRMGLNVVMITGDNELCARAVAQHLGGMDVIAGVLPDGKAEVIRALSDKGGVCMVGDGINDAPSLAISDVGVAVGSGTDIAIDTADIVLTRKNLYPLVNAIRLSRATLKNIYENLFWAFIYNIIGIPLAAGVFTSLFGWSLTPMFGAFAMSLSSFTVVMNALRLRVKKIFKPEPTINHEENISSTKGDIKMKKSFKVEGMMCPHCEAHVKKSVMAIPGVTDAVASHKESSLVISYEGEVDFELVKSAVREAGYTIE